MISSGGCWRSASITQTQGARAARRPCTTAPPRPPTRRLDAWRRSTISRLLRLAASSTGSARAVAAGVDEDDLHGDGGQHRLQPLDQRGRRCLARSWSARRSTASGSSRRTRPELNRAIRAGGRAPTLSCSAAGQILRPRGELSGAATRRRGERKRAVLVRRIRRTGDLSSLNGASSAAASSRPVPGSNATPPGSGCGRPAS